MNDGRISKKDISADIVTLSSLARGDVSNVIDSLLDTVPKYLLMGKSVNLGDLGMFRLSFTNKDVDTPETFNTNMISGVRYSRQAANLSCKKHRLKRRRKGIRNYEAVQGWAAFFNYE